VAQHILIVDDDPDVAESLRDLVETLDYVPSVALDGETALERLAEQNYAAMICNVYMPGISGIEVVRKAREGDKHLPVVMITAHAECESEAMSAGAQGFLVKPFNARDIKVVLRRLVPFTREELIRDHSGGEDTLSMKALSQAKAGAFTKARKTIELLDNIDRQRIAYIKLLVYQVRAGDLVGAKQTVLGAPAMRIGGHWVRCLVIPLVKAGDIGGALEIVERLTEPSDRGFHKRVVVALQAMAGDITGALQTCESISREEGHRDGALGTTVEAQVAVNDFSGAIATALRMEEDNARIMTMAALLAVCAKADVGATQSVLHQVTDPNLRSMAREAMEQIQNSNVDPIRQLSLWRAGLFLDDMFEKLYPQE
jgi:CheY-like chemotaxis protein